MSTSAAPLESLIALAWETPDTATCLSASEVSVVGSLLDPLVAVAMSAVPVPVLSGSAVPLGIAGVDASLVSWFEVASALPVVVSTRSVVVSGSCWLESVPVLSEALPLLEVPLDFAADPLSVDELDDRSAVEDPSVPEVSLLPAVELALPVSDGDA